MELSPQDVRNMVILMKAGVRASNLSGKEIAAAGVLISKLEPNEKEVQPVEQKEEEVNGTQA